VTTNIEPPARRYVPVFAPATVRVDSQEMPSGVRVCTAQEVTMTTTDDLDWDDLRYFLHAVRAKTLAGAARALEVEHTTIGRRLTGLERAIGSALVLRGPEGLTLTPLGERVLPLVEEVERAVQSVQRAVASNQTRVRLAVPSGFTRFFADGIARLRRDHPELSLELVSGARIVDLKKGEADLALRIGPVTDPELVARKVGDSSWALYAAESYLARRSTPADPDDLRGHDVIGYDASLASVPAAQWIESRGATVVLRSREMTDMHEAVASGLGLAAIPCSMGDADATLCRVSGVLGSRDISLVYRRESRLSEPVRAVVQFVVAIMAENAEQLGAKA
jgi:DNA-binding transcriptional LysR family regulator